VKSLEGRKALVTGAGTRLGRAIADYLVDQGLSVAFHCHGSVAGARAGAGRARERGRLALVLEADLADPEQARALARRAAEALSGLDLLVNNAARFGRRSFSAIDADALDQMMAVNFKAPFLLTQAALPYLGQHGGCVINVLDVGAERAWRGYAHYCSSKAALAMLTRVLALELAPGIRVNGVAPGTILWPTEGVGASERTAELKRIPLGHEGSPRDVAEAVAFLASHDYITGEVLRVDGGRGV
jgi:pteridine reductase